MDNIYTVNKLNKLDNKIELQNKQDVKTYISWLITVLYNTKVDKDLFVTFINFPNIKVKLNLRILKT